MPRGAFEVCLDQVAVDWRQRRIAPQATRTTAVENRETTVPADPWRDAPPVCRVYSAYAPFRKLLESYLGSAVKLTDSPQRGAREGLLVDCTGTLDALSLATQKFPEHPIIAVLSDTDAASAIGALSSGADGVIALTDPPDMWRECAHVVLGGGRWLGGPALDVQLENNRSSYEIATNRRNNGNVTLRTQLFVRSRVGDKTGT
jgi:hypothetical protein